MLVKRSARPTRTVDLKTVIGQLTSEFNQIREIYIFGSRRFQTGSVRSDIDLLFVMEGDTLDYHFPKRVREVEPYIDAFQAVGSSALSVANHSQIKQESRELLLAQLSAIRLWSASSGWVGPTEFERGDVLSGAVPEYTDARLKPGVIDPAGSLADIVVVTALQKEYDAICARLGKVSGCERFTTDAGEMFEVSNGNGDELRIVVVRAGRMGPVSAAVETILAIKEWSPNLVVLAGITAGIAEEHVELGDLVIPDRVLEYEALKVEDHSSRFHGLVSSTSAAHARRILQWKGLTDWARKWGPLLPDPRDEVKIHTDAIASGAKVVASKDLLDQIARLSRKVCSVEMEAVGVAEACSALLDPTPFIVVKVVTDLADAEKDDRYHPVACEAIADLLASLLETGGLG